MLDKEYEPAKVDVGWCIDEPLGAFVFPKPEPLFKKRSTALSNRAVQACPAVNELERDLYVVTNPFDLRLRCIKRQDCFDLHVVEDGTRIDDDLIPKFVVLMHPKLWRASSFPTIQIKIPYFFLCDEPCYMTQTPPYMSNTFRKWPGVLISGRFPINIWPRILNWAFEWTDLSQDLILRRGDPLCYFYFETGHLRTKVNMCEIENTPELREYRQGISGVPKYMSNTFSLFETALERRPRNLMVKKSNA